MRLSQLDIVHEQKFENEYPDKKDLHNAFKTTVPSEESNCFYILQEDDSDNDESIFDCLR